MYFLQSWKKKQTHATAAYKHFLLLCVVIQEWVLFQVVDHLQLENLLSHLPRQVVQVNLYGQNQ